MEDYEGRGNFIKAQQLFTIVSWRGGSDDQALMLFSAPGGKGGGGTARTAVWGIGAPLSALCDKTKSLNQ